MQLFWFSPKDIPGVKIEIIKKIDTVDPETAEVKPGTVPVPILDNDNGYIGVFPHETKLQIRLEVEGKHECYVLEPNTLKKTVKAQDAPGKYSKNFTVSIYQDKFLDEHGLYYNKRNREKYSGIEGIVAQWPSNMVCLEIPGHTYNIGLTSQNGRIFFVIEEYQPSPMNLPQGMVVAYSLLRGGGTVAYEQYFDARVNWRNVPVDKRKGLRFMQTGDLLEWEKDDLVSLGCNTTFKYEINRCVNLSLPQ